LRIKKPEAKSTFSISASVSIFELLWGLIKFKKNTKKFKASTAFYSEKMYATVYNCITATKWLTVSVKYLSLYYEINISEIQAYTTIWIFNLRFLCQITIDRCRRLWSMTICRWR
jgi:hypothetical protein